MFRYVELWWGLLVRCLRSHRSLLLENLALRQQLGVVKRKRPRPRMGAVDKIFWVLARRFWGTWNPSVANHIHSGNDYTAPLKKEKIMRPITTKDGTHVYPGVDCTTNVR